MMCRQQVGAGADWLIPWIGRQRPRIESLGTSAGGGRRRASAALRGGRMHRRCWPPAFTRASCAPGTSHILPFSMRTLAWAAPAARRAAVRPALPLILAPAKEEAEEA